MYKDTWYSSLRQHFRDERRKLTNVPEVLAMKQKYCSNNGSERSRTPKEFNTGTSNACKKAKGTTDSLQYRAMINCSSKAHQKLLVAALLICNWSCFYCSSIILFLDHIEGKNSYVGRILIEYEICVLLCRYIPYTPYINQGR